MPPCIPPPPKQQAQEARRARNFHPHSPSPSVHIVSRLVNFAAFGLPFQFSFALPCEFIEKTNLDCCVFIQLFSWRSGGGLHFCNPFLSFFIFPAVGIVFLQIFISS